MRKNNNRAEFRKSLGLVLVFVGMQFNTAIKNVILGMDISIVIMLLSALLLFDIKGIAKIRMSNKTFLGVRVYSDTYFVSSNKWIYTIKSYV